MSKKVLSLLVFCFAIFLCSQSNIVHAGHIYIGKFDCVSYYQDKKGYLVSDSVREGSGVIGCNIILEDGYGGTFYFRQGIKHWSYSLTIGGLNRSWTRVSYDGFEYKLLNYILDNYE